MGFFPSLLSKHSLLLFPVKSLSCQTICPGSLSLRWVMSYTIFLELYLLKNNVMWNCFLHNIQSAKWNRIILFQLADLAYCAVLENIHTPPWEVFLFCTALPPGNSSLGSYFASKLLNFLDSPLPRNFWWPSMGLVWIFSGTARWELRPNINRAFTPVPLVTLSFISVVLFAGRFVSAVCWGYDGNNKSSNSVCVSRSSHTVLWGAGSKQVCGVAWKKTYFWDISFSSERHQVGVAWDW